MPRGKRRIRWRGSAGFTLVELLVALVLFGLLSAALFSSVRDSATVWIRATAQAEQNDHRIHVQDLLRHLIESAYPFFVTGDPNDRRIDFGGTERSLGFLSTAPMALGNGGRSRIKLATETRDNGVNLIFESKPELAVTDSEPEKTRRLLLTGASAVAFSYFGKKASDRSAVWSSDWTAQPELPRLVRIEVRFGANDTRGWPNLIVAPRISADVGCVLNPLWTRCEGR